MKFPNPVPRPSGVRRSRAVNIGVKPNMDLKALPTKPASSVKAQPGSGAGDITESRGLHMQDHRAESGNTDRGNRVVGFEELNHLPDFFRRKNSGNTFDIA